MTLPTSARLLFAAAGAALLVGATAATAGVDVHWVVSGAFADGGALNGFFDIDQYGFITDWDLTTSGASSLEYKRTGESGGNTANSITVGPDYQDFLHLTFDAPLTALNASNALTVTGSASYECFGSFDCPVSNNTAITRFLTSGSAVGTSTSIGGETGGGGNGGVPEPATWALVIAGFGLTGAALRRQRKPSPLRA